MCMGSSPSVPATPEVQAAPQEQDAAVVAVSYTHLTLPTIYSV